MQVSMKLVVAAACVWPAFQAAAVPILDTGEPEAGFLGFYGYDIYTGQDVGIAVTVNEPHTLDSIGLWIMSNDFEAAGRTYTVTLRVGIEGSNNGIPGPTILESWNVSTAAVGWTPTLDTVTSVLHPTLEPGVQYWVVAESDEQGGEDPVWVVSNREIPTIHGVNNFANPEGWTTGPGMGNAPGITVYATPVGGSCPADLDDGSGTGTPDQGVDINDLLYFLAQFELGNETVDLDNGSGTGTPDGGVDINDLIFFLTRFEAGC